MPLGLEFLHPPPSLSPSRLVFWRRPRDERRLALRGRRDDGRLDGVRQLRSAVRALLVGVSLDVDLGEGDAPREWRGVLLLLRRRGRLRRRACPSNSAKPGDTPARQASHLIVKPV